MSTYCNNNLQDQPGISDIFCINLSHCKGSQKFIFYALYTSQEHRGQQNFGAPPFFFGVFLMVYSHLCWQCSNKNRKCREHINTLGKKDKLIFLKPIFEIKTKNLLSTFFSVFLVVYPHFCRQYSDKTRKCQEHINTLGKKDILIFLMPILEII